MKKLLACVLGTALLLLPLSACAESGPSSSGASAEPLPAGLLQGATAQISEAESLGIRAVAADAPGGGAQALSFASAAPQNEETPEADIVENAEFVLKDGQGEYSEVEFSQGEETVTLSRENAQITKLYTTYDYTFFAVGIIPPASAPFVRAESLLKMSTSYNELVEVQPATGSRDYFADVKYEIDGKQYHGYVPSRTYEGDHYYEAFDYWNDDLNRSFVMDNKTGEVYDLGAALPQGERYIRSVENGVLLLPQSGLLNVEIRDGRLVLEEITLFEEGFGMGGSVLKDRYGHLLIETNGIVGPVSHEIVSGDKLIVIRDSSDRDNLLLWDCYRVGSDGRIYKFVISLYPDYNGSEEELGIFYLDENMQWKPVEKGTDVDIPQVWVYDNIYRGESNGLACPHIGGIRNGELLIFNGHVGRVPFTAWEKGFPDSKACKFSGVAAFSAEQPLAHTANGSAFAQGDAEELIESYILSPEAWVTLENGELRRHNVFEAESELLAEGASLVGFDYEKGVLTVQAGGEKYLLCNGEGSELTAQYPNVPVRECLVESVLHR